MPETTLRQGPAAMSSAGRYQLVVQVTAEPLAEGEASRSELECGQRLTPDTARSIFRKAPTCRYTFRQN